VSGHIRRILLIKHKVHKVHLSVRSVVPGKRDLTR